MTISVRNKEFLICFRRGVKGCFGGIWGIQNLSFGPRESSGRWNSSTGQYAWPPVVQAAKKIPCWELLDASKGRVWWWQMPAASFLFPKQCQYLGVYTSVTKLELFTLGYYVAHTKNELFMQPR